MKRKRANLRLEHLEKRELLSGNPAMPGGSLVGAAGQLNLLNAQSSPAPLPAPLFADALLGTAIGPAYTIKGGSWSEAGGALRQLSASSLEPKKVLVTGQSFPANVQILARVRVDFTYNYHGDSPQVGVGLATSSATGYGYNLVFRTLASGQKVVQFLDDPGVWGNAYAFNWSTGTWYWFKLENDNGTLNAKVWQDGTPEPAAWMFTQAGWADHSGGAPSLNGGSAFRSFGTASFSNLTIWPAGASNPVIAPIAPASLSAAAVSTSQIKLSWQDVSGETGFAVQRSATGASGWTQIGTTAAGVLNYQDSRLSAGTTYFYRVQGLNAAGGGAFSPMASAATSATMVPPAAPTGLNGSAMGPDQIMLSWQDVAGESGFIVQRSTNGTSGWTQIGSTTAGVLIYQDFGLKAATTYYYRIQGLNASGVGGFSATASAATFVDAPAGLSAVVASATQINLSWQNVAGATGFIIQRSANGTSGWTQVGTTAAGVLTFQDNGLTAGTTYYYRVQGTNSAGGGVFSATAGATTSAGVTPPAAPAGLAAAAANTTQINLSWQDVAGETGFVIQRSADGSTGWTQVGTTTASVLTFQDTGLTASTKYYYRVQGLNSAGGGAFSAAVSAATPAAVTPPAAPAGLTAAAASTTQINLSWQDVTGESGFVVQRSADGSTGWTQVGTTAAGVLAFQDSGLTAGTKYYYRVQGTNSAGGGAFSTTASATTSTLAAPPAAPAGLSGAAASTAQINLSWQDVAGETGFVIQRSATGTGGWTQVGTTAAGVLNFQDSGLTAGTTYFYRVQATGAADAGAFSAAVSVATFEAAPAGLTATPASATQINLSWQDVAGETGFVVQRSATGTGGWTQVGTTTAGVLTFQDTGLTAGTTYFYRVQGINSAGGGTFSATASATTSVAVMPPAAPAGLSAAAASTTQINLSWQDVTGESGFVVQRSADGSTGWTQVGTTAAGVLTFQDSGLTAGTKYYYRVQGTNSAGGGAFSTTASTTTVVAAPAGLTAVAASATQINLSWQDVTGETGFVVQRSATGTSGWTQVGTTAAGVLTFQDNGLTAGTTYYYRVQGLNSAGGGTFSATASATTSAAVTPPAAPAGMTAAAASTTQINLSWQDVTGESGFVVQRSADGSTGWTQVGTTSAGVLAFQDSGLTAGTTYYYRVQGTNSAGGGAFSTTASAATVVAAPAGLTAAAASATQINLSWQDVTGEAGFVVQRSATGTGGWAQVGTTVAGVLTYQDSGLTAGTKYYYRVQASGGGTFSATTSATTTALAAPPAAPAGLTATAVSSSQLSLSWQDVAGEAGFKIERSADGSTGWTQIGTTGAGVLSYQDTGLATSTTYYYRVRGTNAAGDGAYSAVVSGTTAAAGSVLFSDNFNSGAVNPAWSPDAGTWTVNNGVLQQTDPSYLFAARKLLLTGVTLPTDIQIAARVRVDSWGELKWAGVGLGLFTDPTSGNGYNLSFHSVNGQHVIQFLNDYSDWGNSYNLNWSLGTWYQVKLQSYQGTLYAKVWQDGTPEPGSWMLSQSGWTAATGKAPALNGGSWAFGTTASFDDVVITAATPVALSVAIGGFPAGGVSPEGTAVTLQATVAGTATGGALTYGWSVLKNNAPFASGQGQQFTFTPDDNGTYVVTVTASDTNGDTATVSESLTVTNVPPTVTITGAPASATGSIGNPITLGSTASDVSPVDVQAGFQFSWSVTKNDVAFASGTGPTFTFTPDGTGYYAATVTVSDKDGGVTTADTTIVVGTPDPLLKTVVNQSNFTYLGSFLMPTSTGGGGSAAFSLGGFTMRNVNGQLHFLATGNAQQGGLVYEVNYPGIGTGANLPQAQVTQYWGDIYTGQKWTNNGSSGLNSGGNNTYGLYYDQNSGRLYWNYGWWYNAAYPYDPSLGYSVLNDATGTATGVGAWSLTNRPEKFDRGGVLQIPTWFANRFTGGDTLGVGFGGYYSITSTASFGPALAAISAPNLNTNPNDSALPNIPLIGYPDGTDRAHRDPNYVSYYDGGTYPTQPGAWNPQGGVGYWTWSDIVGGATWIDTPTMQGVLYIAKVGQGQVWYQKSDRHAQSGAFEWLVYDPADLAAVASGAKQQWQIQPKYEWTTPTLPIGPYDANGWQGDGASNIGGIAFDPTTNRLYVEANGAWKGGVEYYPEVYVYQLGGGSSGLGGTAAIQVGGLVGGTSATGTTQSTTATATGTLSTGSTITTAASVAPAPLAAASGTAASSSPSPPIAPDVATLASANLGGPLTGASTSGSGGAAANTGVTQQPNATPAPSPTQVLVTSQTPPSVTQAPTPVNTADGSPTGVSSTLSTDPLTGNG
jgi:hypothetical protein